MHPKVSTNPRMRNTLGRFHFKLQDRFDNNKVSYYRFSLKKEGTGFMQILSYKKLHYPLGIPELESVTFRKAIIKFLNYILKLIYNKGLYRFGKKRKKKKRKNNFGKKKNKISKNMKQLCKKLGIRLTIKRGQKRVYKSIAVLKAQCLKKKRKVKKKKKKVVKKKKKVVKKKKKVKKKSKRRK
jgi:hypothetical protein